MASENWKDKPEAEDYPAAESHLSLLLGPETAAKLVKALRKQEGLAHFAAKDILRASGLPLLGPEDSEDLSEPDYENRKAGCQGIRTERQFAFLYLGEEFRSDAQSALR